MKFSLSLLCENPTRKTGLTTLYAALIEKSLLLYPELSWILYVGEAMEIEFPPEVASRVQIVRDYAGNDRVYPRLFADHFLVAPHAAKNGSLCHVTTGFIPMRKAGLPIAMHMLTLHHLSEDNQVDPLRKFYRSMAARKGLENADLIITNTEFVVSQILQICPSAKDRMIQSYEGLDHADFNDQPEEGEVERLAESYGITPGYLFWSSNFYPYKQAELLMDAYADLPDELQETMPLIMVGGGGWGNGLDEALERAKSNSIPEHRVKHLGWVPDEDIPALFRHAHLFSLPSREETFGRCVLESMACGTPCVVNDIPVMHEVTQGAAKIVDYRDRKATTEALYSLATDEALRTQMIEAGLKRSKDFDFDILAKERVEAIQQMLG